MSFYGTKPGILL